MCFVAISPEEGRMFHHLRPCEDEREFRALPIGSCESGAMSVDDHQSSSHGAHGFWERFSGANSGIRSMMTQIMCYLREV